MTPPTRGVTQVGDDRVRAFQVRHAAVLALVLCLALYAARNPVHASEPSLTTLRFTLPVSRRTSAAILDPEGRVLRTLWSGRSLEPGAHRATWDGRDDAGEPVSLALVRARVVHHDVRYVWEGVIGNTSRVFTGAGVHVSMFPPAALAIVGDAAAMAVGYHELQVGTRGFRLSDPQTSVLWQPGADPFTAWSFVAGDGDRWYWATSGGLSKTTFVMASSRTTRRFVPFAAGRDLCLAYNGAHCYPDQQYSGAIDVGGADDAPPTGLAVQTRGTLLAVARARARVVRMYDRATGRSRGEFTIGGTGAESNQLGAAPDGDLWVIEGTSVRRYTGLPAAPRIAASIDGLSRPLAVAVDPADRDRVLVADGGERQQIRAFDADGRALWTLGAEGGIRDEPGVSAERYSFATTAGGERTALAIAPDGSFWFLDTTTNRLLHFDRERRFLEAIAWLPKSYAATVDPSAPRRVFANYLEYDVDPLARLRPGPDGGWRLVRNWLAGLPARARHEDAWNGGFAGLQSVLTLPNGRTYALASARGDQHVLELPERGPARWLRTLPRGERGDSTPMLYEDGSLRYARTSGEVATVYARDLVEFTADGAPVWSPIPRALARVRTGTDAPTFRGGFSGASGPRFPSTANGDVLFFDPSVAAGPLGRHQRFHLGAFRPADSTWSWRAAPAGPFDGEGAFASGAFDAAVDYGGNMLWLRGRHVVYGYHGEGFFDPRARREGQANRFVHHRDDGTYLGSFGVPTTRASGVAAAGVAGNAFATTLVQAGRELRLYHNDESQHGGVHRWAIAGLDDIVDLAGAGAVGTEITLE